MRGAALLKIDSQGLSETHWSHFGGFGLSDSPEALKRLHGPSLSQQMALPKLGKSRP